MDVDLAANVLAEIVAVLGKTGILRWFGRSSLSAQIIEGRASFRIV
jgi:hypothetical protein